MDKQYSKDVFEHLLDVLTPEEREEITQWHEIRADGVFLKRWAEIDGWPHTEAESQVLAWHPYRNRFAAALPFPFSAGEFAAFCLPGPGSPLLAHFIRATVLDERLRPTEPETIDKEKVGPNAQEALELLEAAHGLLLQAPEVELSPEHADSDFHEQEQEDMQIRWLVNTTSTTKLAETSEQRRDRLLARKAALISNRVKGWQLIIAEEEGLSVSRIKQILQPPKDKKTPTPHNPFDR